jgi:hypothetical protein
MMDFNKIVPLLGKSERDEQVMAMLSELGVRQPIFRPKKGSSITYVEFQDSPSEIHFVFKTIKAIKTLKAEKYLEGELIFHTVAFRPHEEEIARNAVLPYGVNLQETLSWHVQKFGKPQWSNPNLENYRWLFDNLFVFLSFSKDREKIMEAAYFICDGVF